MPSSRSGRKRYGGTFDYREKRERLEEVDRELEDPNVWSEPERAQALGRERAGLADVVETLDKIQAALHDAGEFYELAREESDEAALADVATEVERTAEEVERLEFLRMFSNEMDSRNAFLDIQAGSGGTRQTGIRYGFGRRGRGRS